MPVSSNDRLFFRHGELRAFLQNVEKITNLKPKDIFSLINVSSRTYRDWKREKYSVSAEIASKLCTLSNLPFPSNVEVRSQYWHTSSAGKMGGRAQFEKNKSIGGSTINRVQHWRNWWEFQGKFNPRNTAILQRHTAKLPCYSPDLAEFVGILLGDGGISKYQITITLNWTDDREYLMFVHNLCFRLFNIQTTIIKRKNQNVGTVTISRVELVDFFVHMGFCLGNKVRQQIAVPPWILKNNEYIHRCIRGLIDTDGSFYVDKHTLKDRNYSNAALNFTNRSLPLLAFIKDNLEKLGLHPTQKTPYAIFLRREADIKTYFNLIGTSNPKHFNKYKGYVILRQTGGVPKRS